MNGPDTYDNVFSGRQNKIRGAGTIPDAAEPTMPALLAGVVLAAATTYFYALPVTGSGAIDVTLRIVSHTGTVPTASIYKTMADGVTEKMNAAGASAAVPFAAFADGVQQTVSITSLRGERVVVLKIVVPAASTVTFDQAEHSSK